MRQTIVVLDFGSQFNQLIARRIRENNVYSVLLPYNTSIEKIKSFHPIGIIFTGGAQALGVQNAPRVDKAIYELNVPILAIGNSCLLVTEDCGGKISSGELVKLIEPASYLDSPLYDGLDKKSNVFMNYTDYIFKIPSDFLVNATTKKCIIAGMESVVRKIYCVQFHPEVSDTTNGAKIISNFVFKICKAAGDWSMQKFAVEEVARLKEKIGNKKVLCALSGGVDSAVSAALVHKACPNLTCVFVDHGLMRKNESEEVVRVFSKEQGMNLIKVDAGERFLRLLAGVTEPEKKRKIIGEEFIRVFEEEAKKIGKVDYLVQGTIYPDVVESGIGGAVIKSHHNVGGLPSVVDFQEIIEPLRELFKDEVRACGKALGLPDSIVNRQPFPGPGLGIRIIGEITHDKVAILQEADFIYREEIALAGLDKEIWQYFAILTGSRTVGVIEDTRTYDYTLALRAVNSVDGMTADWARVPYDVLQKISARIVGEVKHINRVVLDITTKPPATIEWE